MRNTATFNKTVIGYKHIKKNALGEDFSASYSDPFGVFDIAVLSDGHGDSSCFRSAKGSEFAVNVTLNALREFAEQYSGNLSLFHELMISPREKRFVIKHLTDSIVSQWYETVNSDLLNNPITEEEFLQSGAMEKVYRSGQKTEHIYGATLIACLRLNKHFIMFQQGDGRCIVLLKDGTAEEPVPWDERCHENVTTSMCDEDAALSVRSCVFDLGEKPIVGCILCSDGIEDSYTDQEGYHVFCKNTCILVHESKYRDYDVSLGERLAMLSEKGSADDISIGAILDIEAFEEMIPNYQAETVKYYKALERKEIEQKIVSMERKHSVLKKNRDNALAEFERERQALSCLEKEQKEALALRSDFEAKKIAEEQKEEAGSFLKTLVDNIFSSTENLETALQKQEEITEEIKKKIAVNEETFSIAKEKYENAEKTFAQYDMRYQSLFEQIKNLDGNEGRQDDDVKSEITNDDE